MLNSNASHPLKCTSVGSAIRCCQSVGIGILCVPLNYAPFKGGKKTVIKVREQGFVKIAAAKVYGYTLLSFEQSAGRITRRSNNPKLPDVACHFQVPYTALFDMMRQENFRL